MVRGRISEVDGNGDVVRCQEGSASSDRVHDDAGACAGRGGPFSEALHLMKVAGCSISATAPNERLQRRLEMAKSQKHGNRETRKPKTNMDKKSKPEASSSLLVKGLLTPIGLPKKKI